MNVVPPTHDQLVVALREVVEHTPVSGPDLDVAIQEVRSYLSPESQREISSRMEQGDVVGIRLAALGGLSASTLLRMSTAQADHGGLRWEDWLRATLDAVGMHQIEDSGLRQLAFDILLCALSDVDDGSDAEATAEDLQSPSEQTPEPPIQLPTLSLPHFRLLQKHGREFLQLH